MAAARFLVETQDGGEWPRQRMVGANYRRYRPKPLQSAKELRKSFFGLATHEPEGLAEHQHHYYPCPPGDDEILSILSTHRWAVQFFLSVKFFLFRFDPFGVPLRTR